MSTITEAYVWYRFDGFLAGTNGSKLETSLSSRKLYFAVKFPLALPAPAWLTPFDDQSTIRYLHARRFFGILSLETDLILLPSVFWIRTEPHHSAHGWLFATNCNGGLSLPLRVSPKNLWRRKAVPFARFVHVKLSILTQ